MATAGRPAEEAGLRALMAQSPESPAHMSVAAEAALLLGLGALLTSLFSVLLAVTLVVAAAAVFCGVVGMITTRRPALAGSALSPLGLVLGVVAVGLVGLRYAGLDTAVGDQLGPWFAQQLQHWNSMLPQPG